MEDIQLLIFFCIEFYQHIVLPFTIYDQRQILELFIFQVITPLPSHIPQCKALYDFKMTNDEERDCLTFSKVRITVIFAAVVEMCFDILNPCYAEEPWISKHFGKRKYNVLVLLKLLKIIARVIYVLMFQYSHSRWTVSYIWFKGIWLERMLDNLFKENIT